jgi:hypothetical protein
MAGGTISDFFLELELLAVLQGKPPNNLYEFI